MSAGWSPQTDLGKQNPNCKGHGAVNIRPMSDLDWGRLGEYVGIRRAVLGLTQDAVTARGGPSDTLQNRIEKGLWRPVRGVAGTFKKIEDGMGWAPGSARAILTGGEPFDISNEKETQGNENESDDAEFQAMRQMSDILGGLSPQTQARVLQWAAAKCPGVERYIQKAERT